MKFKTLLNTAKGILTKNSPTILTALGVTGLVTTAVFASRATIKAIRIIDEKKKEKKKDEPPMTKKEIIKHTWKCYIPTLIMGGVSTACIISANSINLKRNAALASLYTLTESTLKEYKSKVVEELGRVKEQKIRDEIAEETIKRDPIKNKEVIITGKGEMLCYDKMSGRYFKGNIENLRRIEIKLNQELMRDMWVSLNELYYEIGLDEVKLGEYLGWRVDRIIQMEFSSKLTEDGEPCLVMDYNVGPREDYAYNSFN